jgi:hypothetical protein
MFDEQVKTDKEINFLGAAISLCYVSKWVNTFCQTQLIDTVEPLLSGLWLTVPLTGMQFLSTFRAWVELWADSRLYVDTRKENGKWASE